jgi:hypothetical protein
LGDGFAQGNDTGTRRVVCLAPVESGRGRGLDMFRYDECLGCGEVDLAVPNCGGFF